MRSRDYQSGSFVAKNCGGCIVEFSLTPQSLLFNTLGHILEKESRTNSEVMAKEAEMYTNPYVAQKYAEMKIREAQRWGEVERMLTEARQPQQKGNPMWTVVAATAIFGIAGMLSGVVGRLTGGGRLYR